ncbi:MAG: hypothetical protein WCD88_16910, partial [Desulfobacterales bacterium]
ARLDPDCAMAYWGMALVLGPNINMAMPPEAEPKAYELISRAVELKSNATEREQAYIEALSTRYTGAEQPDRSALDRKYAEAMGTITHCGAARPRRPSCRPCVSWASLSSLGLRLAADF